MEMLLVLRMCSIALGTGRSSGGNSNALLPLRSFSRSSLSRPAFLRYTGVCWTGEGRWRGGRGRLSYWDKDW